MYKVNFLVLKTLKHKLSKQSQLLRVLLSKINIVMQIQFVYNYNYLGPSVPETEAV